MTAAGPGDAVGMTIKDMVMEIRRDVKEMSTALAVLCAADLPKRVNDLETKRDITIGRTTGIALVVSGLVSLGGIALAAFGFVR